MRLSRRFLIFACLSLLAGATAGAFLWLHDNFGVDSVALLGKRLPTLHLSDGEGLPVDFDRFLGRRLLVVFVDPECGFCRDQFDALLELSKQTGPETPAIVVVVRQDPFAAIDFPPNAELPFPVWVDDAGQLHSKLGTTAVPALFVLDEQGILRATRIGYRDLHEVATFLHAETPVEQFVSATTIIDP